MQATKDIEEHTHRELHDQVKRRRALLPLKPTEMSEVVIKFEATIPTIMQGRKGFNPAEANAEFINCPTMTQTLIENAADKRV